MKLDELVKKHRQLEDMAKAKEVFWINSKGKDESGITDKVESGVSAISKSDIDDAEARLIRFAPYLAQAFPETKNSIFGPGIIESKLVDIACMKEVLEKEFGISCHGKLMLKCDSHLQISGSIKARGGIYEVLKYAESLALDAGLLNIEDNYSILDTARFKDFFSGYSVAVGSTGNLGLSIGIISAKLGFDVTVHMSGDARQWKKDLLREKGAKVVEYNDDYSKAVAEGREAAKTNPKCHFVDDESSVDLFPGYAVAGRRLAKQLAEKNIKVDEENPLFVYIPCGVGGAPGGVAFGLSQVFGNNVHCFFAEPAKAPAVILGLMTGLDNKISATDIGLDGKTIADGLAVSRPSALVCKEMKNLLDGCFTIDDNRLLPLLRNLAKSEGILIEPSACAAFPGPFYINGYGGLENVGEYLQSNNIADKIKTATHIIWATGGNMVPKAEMDSYLVD